MSRVTSTSYHQITGVLLSL